MGDFLAHRDELSLEMVTDSERQYLAARTPATGARGYLGIRRRLAPY
jgi:hypothetical protein